MTNYSDQVKEAFASNKYSNINLLISKCITNAPDNKKLAHLEEFCQLWQAKGKKIKKSKIGKTISDNLNSLKEELAVESDTPDGKPKMIQLKDINLDNYKMNYLSFIDSKQLMPPVVCPWEDSLAQHYLKKSNVLPIKSSVGMVTTFYHLENKYWNKPITEFTKEFYQRFESKKDDTDHPEESYYEEYYPEEYYSKEYYPEEYYSDEYYSDEYYSDEEDTPNEKPSQDEDIIPDDASQWQTVL